MTERPSWTNYIPYFLARKTSQVKPVEVTAYLPGETADVVLSGMGVSTKGADVTRIALWNRRILGDGLSSEEKGPKNAGRDPDAALDLELHLPAGYAAVAFELGSKSGKLSSLTLWGRQYNAEVGRLIGPAVKYTTGGETSHTLAAPIPELGEQSETRILIGVGAGVYKDGIGRIAAAYTDLGQAPDPNADAVVIYGTVDEHGAKIEGKNFEVNKLGTGHYQLFFQNAPAGVVPVVGICPVLNEGKNNGSDNVMSFDNPSPTSCEVYSVDVGEGKGKLQDQAFTFAAFFNPGFPVPGLLFGTVDETGKTIAGSEGFSTERRNKGHVQVNFTPHMEAPLTMIVTSGNRSNESGGSDDIISIKSPNLSQSSTDCLEKYNHVQVYSLDVGDDKHAHSQDEVFSFFAWDNRVLPSPILGFQSKKLIHSSWVGGQFKNKSNSDCLPDNPLNHVVGSEQIGTGHQRIIFNMELPFIPIPYGVAIRDPDGESNGANRIISFGNLTTSGYDAWCMKINSSSKELVDGAFAVMAAIPSAFPI